VSDSWLDRCGAQRKFLPAEPFLVKDRSAERQHKFSLSRWEGGRGERREERCFSCFCLLLSIHVLLHGQQYTSQVYCFMGNSIQARYTAS